jgi:SAM-dependent methyltransferase
LYTTRFAELGADVTGIDFSGRSIRHARETARNRDLTIDYREQNYLDFQTSKRFDLITMIYCDFCALSPAQRKTLLAIFGECLGGDGAILLDVCSLGLFAATEEKRTYSRAPEGGFWSAEPYYEFLNTFKYSDESLLLHKHTIFEVARIRQIFNWLQCFSPESIAEEFREHGFFVEEHYANVAGDPHRSGSPEIAVVARRA